MKFFEIGPEIRSFKHVFSGLGVWVGYGKKWLLGAAFLCSGAVFNLAYGQSLDVLELQLAAHPALAALGAAELAERERSSAALGLPDPVISVGLNNVPIADPAFDRFLPTNKSIGFSQSIPGLKQRRALAGVATAKADKVRVQQAQAFAILRARLVGQLAQKNALEEQITVLDQQAQKYTQLEEVIASELDAGRPVSFRMADIDVERAEVARERALLEGQYAVVKTQLVELLTRVPNTPTPIIKLFEWSGQAQDFYAVLLMGKDMAIAKTRVTGAKAAFGPDWGVNLAYQQREVGRGAPGAVFAGDDWFSAGVSFTLPLWAKRNQQPKLRAVQAEKTASQYRYDAVARQTKAQWTALQAQIITSGQVIIVLKEKILALGVRANALSTNYEAGLTDYSPIIDSEIARLTLRRQLVEEQARRTGIIARANSMLVSL